MSRLASPTAGCRACREKMCIKHPEMPKSKSDKKLGVKMKFLKQTVLKIVEMPRYHDSRVGVGSGTDAHHKPTNMSCVGKARIKKGTVLPIFQCFPENLIDFCFVFFSNV